MAAFKVNLLTPTCILAKELEADSLLVPTSRGQINVLPKHTHLISKIDTGVLSVVSGEKKNDYLVTTGLFKVLGDTVTVLVMTSEKAEAIDQERAQKALKLAEEKLSGKDVLSDVDFIKYERKLERAKARIQLAYSRGA